MYVPASFRENRLGVMHGLIEAHPLGTLVTCGQNGLLASPVPFLLVAASGEHGVLRTHMARANPHWKDLTTTDECLVIFLGADGYVTPSWYPGKADTHKVVPTWNYAAVHVRGRPVVMDDADWLERQLIELTRKQEGQRPLPWALTDAPVEFIAAQKKAIIGIEIAIMQIEGKWKMSQNKEAADRRGVIQGMRDEDDPHRNPAVADLVEGCGKQ
jgi:transcriptional regulator